MEEIIRAQLGLPKLVAVLTGLLGETDVQLYLAGVVILGKVRSYIDVSYITKNHTPLSHVSLSPLSVAKLLLPLLRWNPHTKKPVPRCALSVENSRF